ncbi:HoxN/HupN/NixA family nickel/cobalt transporter [Cryobacterium sp. Hh7]|uniref:HoxN/HupN/NixA family nickel/cobalt transporter n=1 Tax=Cryobacterium sp. Hh7 TaxID=1259159 RepID=UPI00106D4B6A|nr:HoxN/HupN/NixA family nickel/cobalt transporter [Cryobacterium sp. Hh7]TFD59274.1 HoxN/HupN/NixA family nickel/cobalt transporter [Cryobacterium sp. Hh7]
MTRTLPVLHRSTLLMATVILVLHLLGWGLPLLALAAGQEGTVVLTLALTAYLLGVRHALDADHIAAIDNVTRTLSSTGRRTTSLGFWFALGHSTVVVATVAFLALGVHFLVTAVQDDSSPFRQATALWGMSVSVLVVLAFGIVNLHSFVRLARTQRRAGAGQTDAGQTDAGDASSHTPTGPLFRLFRPITRLVDRPSRMYPLGILFGLGFDTAVTIGLFVTAGAASMQVSLALTVALPLLFTAGMCLFDTVNGAFMSRLYGWATGGSIRAIRYNLVMTGLSVAAAFVVVTVGLSQILGENVFSGLTLPIETGGLGFIVVGAFLLVSLAAALVRPGRQRQPGH